MHVGLVLEGRTDFPVIQQVLSEHFAAQDITFRHLQPELDATTGGYSHGGWPNVKNWCTRNPPADRRALYLEPLFAGEPRCDLICFHLDGDVIEQPARTAGLNCKAPLSARRRPTLVREVLDTWMWPEGDDSDRARHARLAAIHATETWIVASTRPEKNVEGLDPVPILIALKPTLEDPDRPGFLKRKDTRVWTGMVEDHLVGKVPDVVAKCPTLRASLQEVAAAMDEE